jgi:ABC-type nitrate/sulfonate/bicarbonate transport system substrate-binding protein
MRTSTTAITLAAVVTLAAGCGSSGQEPAAAPQATASAVAGGTSLKGICPDTISIQLSWFPEAEYGGIYQLIGPGGTLNPKTGAYSGPLGDTGVNVEVRAGGPLTGNDQVTAQLYKDDSLFMGMLATDEAIQNSAKQPTVAVMSYFDKDPQILMYNPEKYRFASIADIGKTNTTVLYFEGSTYMDYLVGSGQLKKTQVDGSYQGSADRWVSSDGGVVQSGLASSEPYKYLKETRGWDKPVGTLLVYDAGYVNYASALSMRPEMVTKYDACLKKFVPMVQRAWADYLKNPAPIGDKITEMNQEIGEFWQTSAGLNAAAVKTILDRKLAVGDATGTIGRFDEARVQKMIDILKPIFTAQNKPIKDGLKPSDLFTNAYVQPGIGL